MNKSKLYAAISLAFLSVMTLNAQMALPYYSGFDSPSEKAGWVLYKLGVDATYGPWTVSSGGFSAPSKLYHDYNNTGIVEDWYVSPALNFVSLSKITLKIKVHSAAGSGVSPDYFGLWCSSAGQNPSLGQYAEIVDFTNLASSSSPWIDTTINLPSISGSAYIGFKYKNGSNWFDVSIDNITVSAVATGINEEFSKADNIRIYPNPSSASITIDLSQYNPFLQNVTMNLYGADGKRILTKIVDGSNETINTGLPKGFYLYELKDDSKKLKSGTLIIE